MSDGGKGSKPRPFSVDQKTFDNNWDNIFNRKKKTDAELFDEAVMKDEYYDLENEMQMPVEENADEIGKCGCGRSPTGKCIGWHGLTEEDYRVKLAEWEEKKLSDRKVAASYIKED
jgi:hypothetical protein